MERGAALDRDGLTELVQMLFCCAYSLFQSLQSDGLGQEVGMGDIIDPFTVFQRIPRHKNDLRSGPLIQRLRNLGYAVRVFQADIQKQNVRLPLRRDHLGQLRQAFTYRAFICPELRQKRLYFKRMGGDIVAYDCVQHRSSSILFLFIFYSVSSRNARYRYIVFYIKHIVCYICVALAGEKDYKESVRGAEKKGREL